MSGGGRYTDDSKERVREAADMAEVVGARTDLRRAGPGRYMGLCPFHEERTPSFSVDADKKVYHCFGCGASGDVFTFVRETEGVEFTDALELLADRYGVALERSVSDPAADARRRQRDRLFALLERTASYYERVLWESPEAEVAREYLAERGLGEEVLRRFRVGWAPSPWDRVYTASRRTGFTDEELLGAGLASRSRRSDQLYDRFRARITFPLADKRGRVIGFGARTLSSGSSGPKYLNSPEGELYRKGEFLFGLDLARRAVASSNSVLVVEGYTDVLALSQAGFANVVGLMGTALTDAQVNELGRTVGGGGVINWALDADASGQEAVLRSAELSSRRDVTLGVVELPAGLDPADLVVRDGAGRMRELIDRAIPFPRYRFQHVLSTWPLETPEDQDRALEELRRVIRSVPPGITRDELVRKTASRFGLSEDLTGSLLDDRSSPRTQGLMSGRPDRAERRAVRAPARAVLERREQAERTFLALCIALPEQGREALRRVSLDEHFSTHHVRRAAEHLRGHLAAPLDGLPRDDEGLASLMAELTIRADREPRDPAMLEVELLQLEKDRLERQIAAGGAVADLAERREQVTKDIRTAVTRAMERTAGAD
ncbi:MAG TPA: DNA primase [Solirubrobacteraceae bacterium]|nr:DNA primase [Solirubrobacteraceae bacterium]